MAIGQWNFTDEKAGDKKLIRGEVMLTEGKSMLELVATMSSKHSEVGQTTPEWVYTEDILTIELRIEFATIFYMM